MEEYISLATSKIKGKKEKYLVQQELRAHFEDRIDYYVNCGYDYDTAREKVIEQMGDADKLVEPLSNLHNSKRYSNVSFVFSILYFLGIITGAVCPFILINHLNGLDLYDTWVAATVCVASVLVFSFGTLSFVFAHKSQEENALFLNGGLSILNVFLAPLTYLPCGFSILSLIFEFPQYIINYYSIHSEHFEFDYFYYPFGYLIFEQIDATGQITEVAQIILWILMCSFALIPIFCGIISIISGKKAAKNDFYSSSAIPQKRIHRFGIFLIILAIAGAFSITTEICIDKAITTSHNNMVEAAFEDEFKDTWELFEKIELPITDQDSLKIMDDFSKSLYQDYEEYGSKTIISNHNFRILLHCSNNYEDDFNFTGEFDEKRLINNNTSKFSYDEIKEFEKIKTGTSVEDFYNTVGKENIGECWVYNDGTIEYVIESVDENITISFMFKNDELVYIDTLDWSSND